MVEVQAVTQKYWDKLARFAGAYGVKLENGDKR